MLYVSETFINRTEGHRFSESEPCETFTDSPGELFRSMREEYGRCIGKVYIDKGTRAIGWVFEKRMAYEDDSRTTYLREVWVTVHDAEPTRSVEYHYHETAA